MNNTTTVREINLIDLMIYVAKGWRNIFVCMIVMAILMSGVQYMKELQAFKDFKATQEVLPATDEEKEQKKQEEKEKTALTLEQLRRDMPEEEVKAVAKVVRLEKEYDQQLKYLQNSLLMTMSPYNVSIARLQYWVNTDYKVNYNGITEKDATTDIVSAYINRVEDGAWRKEALEKAEADTTLAYFGEMVSVTNTDNSFTITVKYKDEDQLRTMISVLEKELDDYKTKVTSVFGQHKLRLASESVEVTVDNDIYQLQQNRKNNLLTLENNIASYKNAFNDNQKSLYAGQIIVNEEETVGEVIESEEELQTEVVAPPTPQVRVKNLLLGAILGAFLVCAFRAMIYILSGKLKAEESMNGYLRITSLGYIEEKKKTPGNVFQKLDAWLDGLSKRGYGNLTKEQQIEMTVSNIALYCEKDHRKTIYFNSSVNCDKEKTERVKQLLNQRGIEVKEGFSILQDAGALEDMSHTDGVVFFEQAGKSRYIDIQREVKLCKEHEKTVLGLVVLL